MDFSIIFQLRTKKFWWMDVIFYFVISLLVAVILCYLIFLIKNSIQRKDIKHETEALKTVGTDQQKEYENSVIGYQKKVVDFVTLFKNHEFASNVFAFLGKETMPNIWFKQFSLDAKTSTVQLSGESDDMESFSRQVATLESNEYVKSVGLLNSAIGESTRIQFTVNLVLDRKIFSYVADTTSLLGTTTSGGANPIQTTITSSENTTNSNTGNITSTQNSGGNQTTGNQTVNGQVAIPYKSDQKYITAFHVLLSSEVIGTVDQINYKILLTVPSGTDVTNLTTSIVTSPGAQVLPSSSVPENFTNPVTYLITAEDGSTQNYIVTVNVLPEAKPAAKKSSGANILLVIISVLASVAIIFGVVFFALKKLKKRKQI